MDGLWHRGTAFGSNGYFIDAGYDLTPLSHHVLTTDGILGRDTLGETAPMVQPAGKRRRGPRAAGAPIDRQAPLLTPAGGLP